MSRLKTAVIGVGYLGYFHAQKYAANPRSELVAVVDTDPDKAAKAAADFGAEPLTDHRELIGRVDAVSVAATTNQHVAVADDLLRAGIHCLVEKPISTDLGEADRIIAAAEAGRALLQIGHLERFNPAVAALAQEIDHPVLIEARRLTPYRGRGIDVDVVLDLMIHDLDIVLWLAGEEPESIRAYGATVITDKIDVAHADLIFPSGLAAHLAATRVSTDHCRQIQVLQHKSHIMVDCAGRSLSVFGRAEDGATGQEVHPGIMARRTEFEASDPLADEIDAFLASVASGEPPLVGGREGRRAVALALDVARAIRNGLDDHGG